jgi:hypothetical protein
MIRGKKNFIPQTALVFGFGILYKLDDESILRHKNDRIVKVNEEDKTAAEEEASRYLQDVEEEEEAEEASEENVEIEMEEEMDEKKKVATEKEDAEDDDDDDENKNLFPDTSFQIKLISNLK